jgi:hypothetical protein
MCSGLWRYSRHPNFFGEMLCWWGLYIVSLGGTSGEKGGVWTFGGPLLISLLLRFHSGVKMLEIRQMKKPEYRVYALETNIFTPWCYTAIEGEAREIALEKAAEDIMKEKEVEEAKAAAEKVGEQEFSETDPLL